MSNAERMKAHLDRRLNVRGFTIDSITTQQLAEDVETLADLCVSLATEIDRLRATPPPKDDSR